MIKNKMLCGRLKENKIDDVDGLMDLQTQAVYLDDPFLLDEIGKAGLNWTYKNDYEEKTYCDKYFEIFLRKIDFMKGYRKI